MTEFSQDQVILIASFGSMTMVCMSYKVFSWYRQRLRHRRQQNRLVHEEEHFLV